MKLKHLQQICLCESYSNREQMGGFRQSRDIHIMPQGKEQTEVKSVSVFLIGKYFDIQR